MRRATPKGRLLVCAALLAAAPSAAGVLAGESATLPSASHALAVPMADFVVSLTRSGDPSKQIRFIGEQSATDQAARLAAKIIAGDEAMLDAELKGVSPEQLSAVQTAMTTFREYFKADPSVRREVEALSRVLKGDPSQEDDERMFDGAVLKPARVLLRPGREGPARVLALSANGGRLLINGKAASELRPAVTRDGVVGEALIHPDHPDVLVKVYHDPGSIDGFMKMSDKVARLGPLSDAGAAPELLESGEAEVRGRGLVHFYAQRIVRGLRLDQIPHARWPLEELDRLFERLQGAGLELEIPGHDKEWLAAHVAIDGKDGNRAYLLDGATMPKMPGDLGHYYDMLRSLIRPKAAPEAEAVVLDAAPTSRFVTHLEIKTGQKILSVILSASSEDAMERVLSRHRLSERAGIAGITRLRCAARIDVFSSQKVQLAADLAYELLNDAEVFRVEAFGDVESEVYRRTRGALSRLQYYDGGRERMHIASSSGETLRGVLKRHGLESRAAPTFGKTSVEIPIAAGWDPTETILALLNDPDMPVVGVSPALRAPVGEALRERGLLPEGTVQESVEIVSGAGEMSPSSPKSFDRVPAENLRFLEKLTTFGDSEKSERFVVHWWPRSAYIHPSEFFESFIADVEKSGLLYDINDHGKGYRVKITPEWTLPKLVQLLRYPLVTRLEVPSELRTAIENELSKPTPAAARTAPVHPGIEKLSLIPENELRRLKKRGGDAEFIAAALADTSRSRAVVERHGLQEEVFETFDPKTNALTLKTRDWKAADVAAKLLADPEVSRVQVGAALKNGVRSRFLVPALDEERVGPAARFVKIPAGEFEMGPERRKVTLRAHEMQVVPVTQEQYQLMVGRNPSAFKTEAASAVKKLFRGRPADRFRNPVESLSWIQAQQFILGLNLLQSEYNYRMPTEAEWEQASSAGGESAASRASRAIHAGNSSGRTGHVLQMSPNALGLYMPGNVRVWVEDAYEERQAGAAAAFDPLVVHLPSKDRLHVTRGASWADGPEALDPTYRTFARYDQTSDKVGLLLVREPRP